ncbi:transposase [Providencia hangzhouensis]
MDESYFGGSRKSSLGRGTVGKVTVFQLLKCCDKVYTKVIPDAKSRTLLPIIESIIYPDSTVNKDNFASYRVLDVSDLKSYRINHSTQFEAEKRPQKSDKWYRKFLERSEVLYAKFNGITKAHFELCLKECEWHFNTNTNGPC